MKRLRFSTILLITLVGFFLNIERLDIGVEKNLVNLHSFVYVLGCVAVLSTMAISAFWRIPRFALIAIWLGMYLILKLLVFNNRPLIGGIYTYLTITELLMVFSLVFWAHAFSRQMHDVEEAIANITLFDVSKRVKRLEEAREDISTEFVRSRRHGLALSVVIVKMEKASVRANLNRAVQDVMQAMMSRYVYTSLVRAIDKDLRRTDIILEKMNDDEIVLLLPDTTSFGSFSLAERIQTVASRNLGISVSCGIASFPDEALTFDDLVRKAESYFPEQAKAPAKPVVQLDTVDIPGLTQEHPSGKVEIPRFKRERASDQVVEVSS